MHRRYAEKAGRKHEACICRYAHRDTNPTHAHTHIHRIDDTVIVSLCLARFGSACVRALRGLPNVKKDLPGRTDGRAQDCHHMTFHPLPYHPTHPSTPLHSTPHPTATTPTTPQGCLHQLAAEVPPAAGNGPVGCSVTATTVQAGKGEETGYTRRTHSHA